MKAWGRLLRLSLAPSALADVAAGAVWAQGGFDARRTELWMLLLASGCVYHGGMALNDWADRDADAQSRPDRPIASGAISARSALSAASLLFVTGVALAWSVDPACGTWMSAVAACAIVYDLAGRGRHLGPALLALCRAGNLGAGIVLGVRYGTAYTGAQFDLGPLVLGPPLLYGAYVYCVSRVGRMEDAEDAEIEPRPWILAALALLCAVPWLPPLRAEFLFDVYLGPEWHAHHPIALLWMRWGAMLLVLLAVMAPLRLVLATRAWTRPIVLQSMGMLLRRLLVFTAALALARGSLDGAIACAVILCGYPLSFALRRVFPPS